MPVEILTLSNFDGLNETARSTAATAAAAAQTNLTLQGAAGFKTDVFVVIDPMSEVAEIRQISSIAGTQLTFVDNLVFAHTEGALVLQLAGDQLKLYRAANVDGTEPDVSSFSSYSGTTPNNPVAIEPDSATTVLTDPNGGKDFWYRYTYYNSVPQIETDLKYSVPVRGGDYGHFVSLEDIRTEAGFTNNPYVTDESIDTARASAEAEINGVLSLAGYTLPIATDVPILTVIAKLLAAGYLLMRDYGTGAEGTNKDGAAMKKEARDLLAQISGVQTVLVDAYGVALPKTTAFSDDTGTIEGADCHEPIFTMEDQF